MTGASKGLQKALARAGSSVIAIAEMQAADLLAEMTEDQKTAVAAALAPASADAGMKPKKEGASEAGEGDGDDDDSGADPKPSGEGNAGPAAAGAIARVKAVAKAVENEENCKGKAALALNMLADDDFANLSAGAIIKLLGQTPLPSVEANEEASALAEMRSAIAETGNSNVDANAASGQLDKQKASAAVWDEAIAAAVPGRKVA